MNNEELESALQANAKMATPAPDPQFLRSLEDRLVALDIDGDSAATDGGKVVPFARRARRISGATIVISLVIAGAAAAAAGIVVVHPFADDKPSAPVTTVVDTTAAPTTTVPATSAPATTAPAVVPVSSTPETTVAPTTAPASTTNEVHTPATITVTCTLTGQTANCSWTPLAGTDHYLVLRGQLVPAGSSNVLFPGTATSMAVPLPTLGDKYSVVIQAMNAANQSIGHSGQYFIDCC